MEKRIEHFSHLHSLCMLETDTHHFKDYLETDRCIGCGERLLCKSFYYWCSGHTCNVCLHIKCAQLPLSITTHHEYSNHQKHDLFLVSKQKQNKHSSSINCKVCLIDIRYFYYYSPTINDFQVCLKCAKDLQDNSSSKGSLETIQHWSHQHALLCVDRYATFHCDGCNKVSADCSYRCDKCSFWIHQSCADLPKLYTCDHHKHPLTLASSLPEVYCNFFQKCKICKKGLDKRKWVYYCADCRFFAHIPCVVYTTPNLRGGLDDPKLMHLPEADEASMNFMMQKRIKDIISVSVDTAAAPPDHINHWAHQGHRLYCKNKSDVIAATSDHHHHDNSQQLVSSSAESCLMICDGCTKPISFSSDDADVFYECNQCNYILHRYCAQFPIKIETSDKDFVGLPRYQRGEFGIDMFQCVCCFTSSNGHSFDIPQMYCCPLDIWCACLAEAIKHRAHDHPLTQNFTSCIEEYTRTCAACCLPLLDPVNNTPAGGEVVYGCGICDFYFLHVKCAVKPGTVLHRWDPHPLSLVLSLEDVENHPHGFECEFCSEEIDTNGWFYHCSVCDLSFHLHNCMDFSSSHHHYSNVKFGATNIRIEEAHQHNLTYVLNKNNNAALCGGCSQSTKDQPILLCKPCNFIRHPVDSCWKKSC